MLNYFFYYGDYKPPAFKFELIINYSLPKTPFICLNEKYQKEYNEL